MAKYQNPSQNAQSSSPGKKNKQKTTHCNENLKMRTEKEAIFVALEKYL